MSIKHIWTFQPFDAPELILFFGPDFVTTLQSTTQVHAEVVQKALDQQGLSKQVSLACQVSLLTKFARETDDDETFLSMVLPFEERFTGL